MSKPTTTDKPASPVTPSEALVAFLNDLDNAHADRVNPAFKSKYASLAEILDTIKPVAKRHGFAVRQVASSADGLVRVTTHFLHVTGDVFPAGDLAVKSEGLTPQQLGSALTYVRRQALQTACCISVDLDDDGAASSPAPVLTSKAPTSPASAFAPRP